LVRTKHGPENRVDRPHREAKYLPILSGYSREYILQLNRSFALLVKFQLLACKSNSGGGRGRKECSL